MKVPQGFLRAGAAVADELVFADAGLRALVGAAGCAPAVVARCGVAAGAGVRAAVIRAVAVGGGGGVGGDGADDAVGRGAEALAEVATSAAELSADGRAATGAAERVGAAVASAAGSGGVELIAGAGAGRSATADGAWTAPAGGSLVREPRTKPTATPKSTKPRAMTMAVFGRVTRGGFAVPDPTSSAAALSGATRPLGATGKCGSTAIAASVEAGSATGPEASSASGVGATTSSGGGGTSTGGVAIAAGGAGITTGGAGITTGGAEIATGGGGITTGGVAFPGHSLVACDASATSLAS
jgi:hypothetical protein